jgi:hypothetical protein
MIRRFIVFLLLSSFYIINGQNLYKNSVYTLEKTALTNDSFVEIGNSYIYNFYKDSFTIVIEKYFNNKIRKIEGFNNKYEFGFNFLIDSNGVLNHIKFHYLGRESGPEIEFYQNGIIKTYYFENFDLNDIFLTPKVKEINILYANFMKIKTTVSYYKEKNGVLYYFDSEGILKQNSHYKNGKIILEEKY